jgi:MFS family permease
VTQRFFYGWVVLGAAFVIITMSIGTLFTLGVFLRPIEESMGWSRSGIGAIGLFNWIVMGAGGVVSGFVSDRLGTRRVVLVGAIVLGLGLVLSSYVQQVWQLYVTFGLLVGAGVSAFYVPLTVLAIKWFEGRRGMAAAIVSAGNGLGTSIFGRVGTGIVADRVGAKRTLLSALSLQAALIFLYLFATSEGALWGLSLAFGVAYGGAMPLYAVVTREYFGERILGTAYGGVFFISCIGMGLGSFAGGVIHDLLGTYQWLFLGSFTIGMMAIVLGVTLKAPVAVPVPRPSPAMGG